MLRLLFLCHLLLFPFIRTAVLVDSDDDDGDIVQGTFAFPWTGGYDSISSEGEDIEDGRLVNESHKDCLIRLKYFLNNDRNFKRAFPSDDCRKLFIDTVFKSLAERDETYYKRITLDKIIENYTCEDHEHFKLDAQLLNYIDRQSIDRFPEYSQSQLAINKFTRYIIKKRCFNHFFWKEFAEIFKLSRNELIGHVSNLPAITDKEKDIFKSYNQLAKRNGLILALPLALLPTSYWHFLRSQLFPSGSTIIETIFIYIIFLYFASKYAYEQFLFETLQNKLIK